MNIIMLGHSSAGKTTYMAALYYRMSTGLYDYTMRYDMWSNYWYKHYILHNDLYSPDEATQEEEELKQISKNVQLGIYPPPTAIKQEYVFRMGYKNFNEIEFNWLDYRGGALMERSSNSQDARELIDKISNSDALIVFLDGPKLEEPLRQNERYFKRLVYLVKSAITNVQVVEGTYFPISFVITKTDLCNDIFASEGYGYFYNNIFKDILESKKIAGMLTCAMINDQYISNVHWPLFFSINHCMFKFENEVTRSYQEREQSRGLWDSIKEWCTDDDKNQTKQIIDELQESNQVLQSILNEENTKCLYLF